METLTRDEYFPNADSVVSILVRSPQTSFPEHVHEFDEMVIARSGSGMNYVDGNPAPICRGSVFYIRANQTHFLDRLDDLHLTNVLLLPTRFKHVRHETISNLMKLCSGTDCYPYVIGEGSLKKVESLLNRIANESESGNEYQNVLDELLIGQLMFELWQSQSEKESNQKQNSDRLTKILRYLNRHCDEEIDWDLLATRFGVSLRTLNRKITDITGMSPSGYLLRIRLCRAMNMLRGTAKSVTDIAFTCGFNDCSYFTSRFHREIGMTPMNYRNNANSLNSYKQMLN